MKEGLLFLARQKEEKCIEDYRQLHKIPEQGLRLPKTVSYVKERLLGMGLTVTERKGGLWADMGSGEEGVLLRADMDGLEIGEKTGLEFASRNERMHACGHDMHTAMLLCAAELLKERENRLKGRVRLFFQTGEETLEGANAALGAGLLEGIRVKGALALHVLTATEYKTGTLLVPPFGVGSCGADNFSASFFGKGCHGATPYLGTDPIAPLCTAVQGIYALGAREVRWEEGDSLCVCCLNAGSSPNAVPDRASLLGTLRSYSDGKREFLKLRLEELCRGIADSYGCRFSFDIIGGAPPLVNDRTLREELLKILGDCGLCALELLGDARGSGSEDFANISRRVPSLMVCVSAGSRAEGYTEPLHSPLCRFNEGALSYGAALYCAFALGI